MLNVGSNKQNTTHVVTAQDVQSEVLRYQANIKKFIDGANELESLLGPSIFPKLIHLGAKIADADLKQEPRPASMLLKMMPQSVSTMLDTGISFIGVAAEVGILPMEMVSRVANDEQEAHSLFNKLKDLRK